MNEYEDLNEIFKGKVIKSIMQNRQEDPTAVTITTECGLKLKLGTTFSVDYSLTLSGKSANI
jgi:hypothetical protein